MKRNLFLLLALILLIAIVLFMGWDMLFNKPGKQVNPYEYDLKSLKEGDTSQIMFAETGHLTPRMNATHGIAFNNTDGIFICGENNVEIYESTGKFVTGFAITGTANCLDVNQDGSIFLGMENHVEVFDKTGKQLKIWKTIGNNPVITSIVVTGKDVFVADAGDKVVYHCDLSGNLLNKIGEKDPAKGIAGFVVPSPYFDLKVGRDGGLWVVNPGRHRLEKYDHDGNILSEWGESTMAMEGFCGCCNPSNFAMLPDGSFVTSEKGIERIKVYGADGKFKYVVAGPGSFIEGTRGLDLAVDTKGRILVLDPEKKQVRIFELKHQ